MAINALILKIENVSTIEIKNDPLSSPELGNDLYKISFTGVFIVSQIYGKVSDSLLISHYGTLANQNEGFIKNTVIMFILINI